MNWGTKKTFQTTNVSLKTWISRFKKVKNDPETKSGNVQRKWSNKGRVHHGDDDGFYCISFDKERYEDACNSDYRLNVSPISCGDFKKPSNGRTMRDFIDEESTCHSYNKSRKGKEVGSLESAKIVVTEDSKLKNMKIDEAMFSDEKRRRRSKQGKKVNAHSRRTLTMVECRFKALEDMKKTRMKMNAFRISVDSFAIVKSSFDPEQDFRDSMMEMMIENEIRQRDKLEELLVYYLTLNCDEYHHLIIKVFQQTYKQFVNL